MDYHYPFQELPDETGSANLYQAKFPRTYSQNLKGCDSVLPGHPGPARRANVFFRDRRIDTERSNRAVRDDPLRVTLYTYMVCKILY